MSRAEDPIRLADLADRDDAPDDRMAEAAGAADAIDVLTRRPPRRRR